ncbi:CobW family GTP-binding protein [Celerinatantimonas yamalensis]|uniref:GTP-binding protein n=1 Tax=Celerinatantimonas yamalensis TaxID=559956 RepID=A0ABW9G4G5_9GAMM
MSTIVHLITGVLGSGKTTLLKHLLNQKPTDERWAFLINELGQLGIDQWLLDNHTSETLFKQVSGGCLCCTQGGEFELALAQLMSFKPQRLFIETTGAGHPGEILAKLKRRQSLTLGGVITLIDASQCLDPSYQAHEIWQQMLAVADLIVLNKQDLADETTCKQAHQWLVRHYPHCKIFLVEYGQIPLHYLTICHSVKAEPKINAILGEKRVETHHSHFVSCSWAYDASILFDVGTLMQLLAKYPLRRIKAYVQTPHGWQMIHGINGQLQCQSVQQMSESRIELIHSHALDWSHIECALDKIKIG